MSGAIEVNTCDFCKEVKPVTRTYFKPTKYVKPSKVEEAVKLYNEGGYSVMISHCNDCGEPTSKTIYHLKFEGIDDWNRPVFKKTDSNIRLGDVNKLWTYNELGKKNETLLNYYRENIDALEYFGRSFNCEPHGGKLKEHCLLVIID